MDGCGLQARSGLAHGSEPSFKNHAGGRLNAKGVGLKEDYFPVRSEGHASGVFQGAAGPAGAQDAKGDVQRWRGLV